VGGWMIGSGVTWLFQSTN